MNLREVINRIRYWRNADRLGPDIPWTQWRLHFKSTALSLCRRKFKRFPATAEFRPGAYAIGCSRIEIGERVVIRPGTMLFAEGPLGITGIKIEDDVLIGCGVHIYTSNHRFDDAAALIIQQGHHPSEPVVLRRGCWIGANVVLLPGVEIGENSVVGAGSVVTKSCPARVVAAGNPCRVIRTLE